MGNEPSVDAIADALDRVYRLEKPVMVATPEGRSLTIHHALGRDRAMKEHDLFSETGIQAVLDKELAAVARAYSRDPALYAQLEEELKKAARQRLKIGVARFNGKLDQEYASQKIRALARIVRRSMWETVFFIQAFVALETGKRVLGELEDLVGGSDSGR